MPLNTVMKLFLNQLKIMLSKPGLTII
jgi:hypothetical protein